MTKVRAIVSGIPRPTKVKPNHAAGLTPPATRAEGQRDNTSASGHRLPSADPEEARVDRLMGLTAHAPGKCELKGTTFFLGGAPVDDNA